MEKPKQKLQMDIAQSCCLKYAMTPHRRLDIGGAIGRQFPIIAECVAQECHWVPIRTQGNSHANLCIVSFWSWRFLVADMAMALIWLHLQREFIAHCHE